MDQIGDVVGTKTSMLEWPYNLRPTPEESRKDEEFLQRYERGEIKSKWRPLSEKQRDRMLRLQAQPYCIFTILGDGEEFTIEMRCDCGVDESFDQTATKPHIVHLDKFLQKHKNCPPRSRPTRKT